MASFLSEPREARLTASVRVFAAFLTLTEVANGPPLFPLTASPPLGGGGPAPASPLDYPATAPGLVCTTYSAFHVSGTLAVTALLATFSHVRPPLPQKQQRHLVIRLGAFKNHAGSVNVRSLTPH